ncbi:MAG: hypothetical protein L0Z62_36820 [Gemmataceae bacterium]|nr:hypothetical protein [Gemmataceae bacterium]
MVRTTMGLCTGVWVVLLAGCALTDSAGFLFFQSSGDERVVAGSVEAVAQATREQFGRLGLQAEVTPQGEALHIDSATPTGQRFRLVLTREKSGNVEKTRIRIDWEGKPHSDMTLQILGRLEQINVPAK